MIRMKEMSTRLGVAQETLRRWDKEGVLPAFRTPSGHRYYTEKQYESFVRSRQKTEFEETATNLGRLIRPKEFSHLIGVSTQTLTNWDKSGKFHAKKDAVGRRYYTYEDYIVFKGEEQDERKES